MKIKFTLVLLFLLFVSLTAVNASAQTIVIKPKKVVYVRKGKDFPKEKRSFTVTYPVVSGAMSAPLKKKIENTISYWRVFETTLQENLTEYDSLIESYYKVNYNKNGILDISLTSETMAAYPDTHTENLIVDLKTGGQVKFKDAFKNDTLGRFAALVDKKLAVEKAEIIKEIDKGDEDAESKAAFKEQVNNLKFTTETFDEFSVSDKGATIIYDAEFPHVIQALQPDGRYFFTWAQLKSFVRRDGILGKFVR